MKGANANQLILLEVSNDRLNRGFTTDMKCDMAILAHMAVGALEYGAAGDFLARAALAGNGPTNI